MSFFRQSIFHHYILTKLSWCILKFFVRDGFFVKTKEFIFHHYILTKFSCCSLKFLVWICTKNWWENSAKKLINSLKLSSLFSFMNKLLKKHTISALTTTVWLPVQVFRMNKHDGWKIIFYEVQIKKRFIVPAKDKGLRPLVESNRHMTHIDFTNVLKIGWVTI